MIQIIPISSVDHPELIPYRTLRRPVEHFQQGKFIAEGEKVVRRLLESSMETISLLMTPEWLSRYRSMIEGRQAPLPVFLAEKKLMEMIVGFTLHQGIMALGKIPAKAHLGSLLAEADNPRLFVAVDGLTNSENLGVLVRNCAGFGVQALLVGETSSSPYLRRAVRNSMGTVFTMPVVHCDSLVETLHFLRRTHQFHIVAAHPHTEECTVQKINLSRSCCIVFGSEGAGLSSPVLSACDTAAAIPMSKNVDSLNVASASAVFLYEVFRQRSVSCSERDSSS